METDNSKIVVVGQFSTLYEAQMALDLLQQNEIKCFLSNEIGSQLYPMFGSSASGIRLHVFEQDVFRAQALLTKF